MAPCRSGAALDGFGRGAGNARCSWWATVRHGAEVLASDLALAIGFDSPAWSRGAGSGLVAAFDIALTGGGAYRRAELFSTLRSERRRSRASRTSVLTTGKRRCSMPATRRPWSHLDPPQRRPCAARMPPAPVRPSKAGLTWRRNAERVAALRPMPMLGLALRQVLQISSASASSASGVGRHGQAALSAAQRCCDRHALVVVTHVGIRSQ